MPIASKGTIVVTEDVEGTENFTVTCKTSFTRFVLKLVVYHT